MPDFKFPVRFIDEVVSDARQGTSIVKQKPRWRQLVIIQDIDPASPTYGEVTAQAHYMVEVCSATDTGGVGPRLAQGKAFSDYPVQLVGNNDCAVYYDPAAPAHPRTGEILYLRGERDEKEWQQLRDEVPEPVTVQGDLLREMLHQAGEEGSAMPPIVLARLLRGFVRQADAPPGGIIANKFLL